MTPKKPETVGDRILRIVDAHPTLPKERKAIALEFGVEYETLRKWVLGKTAPNRNRAVVVSRVLGVPTEVWLHGAQPSGEVGMPDMTNAAALGRALDVVGDALAAAPAAQRAELGDLLRQWAQYGGRALYRDLIADLMGNGEGAGPLGTKIKPLSPEALRVARLVDSFESPARRSTAYAMVQQMAQDDAFEADAQPVMPEAPAVPALPRPPVAAR